MKVTTDGCVFGAWVAEEIQKSTFKIQNILDAGAGTGLLSLMVAQKCAAAITAVEIDTAAAKEAAHNFRASPWADRLKIVTGDLLLLKFPAPFDAIICNPPFYETDLKGPDERRNTAHHSGQLKLDQLFPVLFNNLSAEGTLYLLLPFRRKAELEKMIRDNGFFVQDEVDVIPAEKPTRWMAALTKHAPQDLSFATLRVKKEEGYTTEFSRLLRDYYLNL